jgi:hypothetical protein
MRPLFTIGRQIFVRTVALYASFLVAASVLARMGDAQIGAHQIAYELFIFIALVLDAVAIAGQVIVGRMLGAGDADGAYAAAVRMIGWSVVIGLAFAALLAPLSYVIPRAFTDDPQVLHQAALLWPFLAAMQPLGAAVFALDGILIGAGDTASSCGRCSPRARSSSRSPRWHAPRLGRRRSLGVSRRPDRRAARAARAALRPPALGRGRLELDCADGGSRRAAHASRRLGLLDILWTLAHRQGIALPVKDFWDFDRLVTVSDPRGVPDLDALDAIYHWTELIQSSPAAVEVSVHGAIGGAYRSQGITTLELRFNPMKRNRGGERDLDHIILAAIRGLDVASLEYPQVRAGLILMMDRTFTARQNEIIVEKAIRWAPRGVVGIDIAGPRPGGARYDYSQVQPMVEEAARPGSA